MRAMPAYRQGVFENMSDERRARRATGGGSSARVASTRSASRPPDDLRHLGELDQKLWSVLACPTSGLEFDTRTLQLLDGDGDGRIRAPEIIAAALGVHGAEGPGRAVPRRRRPAAGRDRRRPTRGRASCSPPPKKVLAYVGKADADASASPISPTPTLLFAPEHYNGDGMVPAELAGDAEPGRSDQPHHRQLRRRRGPQRQAGVDQDARECLLHRGAGGVRLARPGRGRCRHRAAAGRGHRRPPLRCSSAGARQGRGLLHPLPPRRLRRARRRRAQPRRHRLRRALACSRSTPPPTRSPRCRSRSSVPGRALPLAVGLNPAWEARIAALRDHGRSSPSWAARAR